MFPKVFGLKVSPPVRAVLITAKALNLELQFSEVNYLKREHLSADYLKLNPLHTVPTLDDDGFILGDSHAIIGYLVDKYGKDDSLYPKDLKKRAIINSRLHFDSGIVFARMQPITRGIIFEGVTAVSQEAVQSLTNVYGLTEALLENNKWIAGDTLSIADFSVFTTITSCDIIVPIEDKKFPKLYAYIKQMEGVPAASENTKGLEQLRNLIKSNLST